MPRAGGLVSWGGGLLRKEIRELSNTPTDWEAEDAIYVEGAEQLELQLKTVAFGCDIKVEFSYDEVNWFQRSIYTTSGSDQIFVATTMKLEEEMSIAVDIPIWAKYCRVSSKHL